MSTEALRNFSNNLKLIREEKRITLENINYKTRIDIKFLEAIEDGNFEVLPEVYVRAFIKEYAASLDLDGDTILKKYDLARKGIVEEKITEEIKTEETPSGAVKEFGSVAEDSSTSEKQAKSQINNQIILAAGGVILIILVIIYFVFIKKSETKIILERPYKEIVQEQENRFEPAENENQIVPPQIIDSLSLKIFASDTTWIQLTIDNTGQQEFMLFPNNVKFLKAASNFRLLIGNSGGVKFFLNDNPLDFAGRKGQIKNVLISENGILPTSKKNDISNE